MSFSPLRCSSRPIVRSSFSPILISGDPIRKLFMDTWPTTSQRTTLLCNQMYIIMYIFLYKVLYLFSLKVSEHLDAFRETQNCSNHLFIWHCRIKNCKTGGQANDTLFGYQTNNINRCTFIMRVQKRCWLKPYSGLPIGNTFLGKLIMSLKIWTKARQKCDLTYIGCNDRRNPLYHINKDFILSRFLKD